MRHTRKNASQKSSLKLLIKNLYEKDCWIDFNIIQQIIDYDGEAIPHLEKILREHLISKNKPRQDENFAVVHAIFLLGHLRSQDSLSLILKLLSHDQGYLDVLIPEAIMEDLWEVLYYLGSNQLDLLEDFILEQDNNLFSRLIVCTTLIQIALLEPDKSKAVVQIFKKLLNLSGEDPDFMGLVCSELLDLKAQELYEPILQAIRQYQIWPGLLSKEDVHQIYQSKHVRKLKPLDIFKRYEQWRTLKLFARPTELVLKVKKSSRIKNQ